MCEVLMGKNIDILAKFYVKQNVNVKILKVVSSIEPRKNIFIIDNRSIINLCQRPALALQYNFGDRLTSAAQQAAPWFATIWASLIQEPSSN